MNFLSTDKRQTSGVTTGVLLAAVPVLVITALLIMGWRKWPDILVDFGREVYVPWQVSSGKVLYRDIAYFFGPLSVYLNATVFTLFGPSVGVLFSANIALYCGFMAFLYDFLRKVGSALAASLACSLLAVWTLSQFTLAGNYNFIAPYSHEAIHGVMLSLVAFDQLRRFATARRTIHLLVCGLLSGCILLTRLEIAAVTLAVMAVFFLLADFKRNEPVRRCVASAIFLGGLSVPLLAFFAYFSTQLSGGETLSFLTEPWRFMVNSGIAGSNFYRSGMGLDALPGNLPRMAYGGAIFLLPPCLLMRVRIVTRTTAVAVWCALAICLSVAGWYWSDRFFFPALPLLIFVITLFLFHDYRRSEGGPQRQAVLTLLLLALFALGLLCKMLFNCRISQYGFYVAVPAVAIAVVFLVGYLPPWLDARGMPGARFRRVMVVFFAVLALRYGAVTADYYAHKTYPVGLNPADRIVTTDAPQDPRGLLVDKTLQWVEANVRPDETVLVVPEGVMINFLSRRENPSRYVNFMMPELLHFGEETILQDFKAHQPDVVMLVLAKDTSEYGVGPFGTDPANGKNIVAWIESAYRPVMLFGGDPLEGTYIGVKIYRKAAWRENGMHGAS